MQECQSKYSPHFQRVKYFLHKRFTIARTRSAQPNRAIATVSPFFASTNISSVILMKCEQRARQGAAGFSLRETSYRTDAPVSAFARGVPLAARLPVPTHHTTDNSASAAGSTLAGSGLGTTTHTPPRTRAGRPSRVRLQNHCNQSRRGSRLPLGMGPSCRAAGPSL